MSSQFVNYVNDSNATNLLNTCTTDVPATSQTVEPKCYLVTFQQTDGTAHTLRLSEDELEALGLKSYFLTSNSDSTEGDSLEQIKDPLIGQTKAANGQKTIPSSSANPVNIIQDDCATSGTQNAGEGHVKFQIADGLALEDKQENRDVTEDVVYRVVYPEELNLKPILNKPKKCGRPKKKAITTYEQETADAAEEAPVPAKSARTRSGRIIRPPRHIEKDFKKIDISDKTENEDVLKTTEFSAPNERDTEQPKIFESLSHTPKKRIISAKYKCPKCQKVYLGRSRMVKHLEDNPDHGPIPEHCKTSNSEVWNYLVDVTQKFPAGKRGLKFCEELSNLLQNLKVLSRYLFKLSSEKNTVAVDAILGSVLDLSPNNYKFNESELHKDVTIFKMLNDMKVFEDANRTKTNKFDCVGDTLMNTLEPAVTERIKNPENNLPVVENIGKVNTNTTNRQNEKHTNLFSINEKKEMPNIIEVNKNEHFITADKVITSNQNELLSNNSLMNSLPNFRCSVDDLILPGIDTTNVSQLLDTTTSPEEVLNVDQLVNERLKSITGADDLSSSGLSLDLPTLDLFTFNNS